MDAVTTLKVPEQMRELFNGEVRDSYQGSLERLDGNAVRRDGYVPPAEILDWQLARAARMRDLAEQTPANKVTGDPEALGDVVRWMLSRTSEALSGECEAVVLDLPALQGAGAAVAWCIDTLRALGDEGARFEDVPVLHEMEKREAVAA